MKSDKLANRGIEVPFGLQIQQIFSHLVEDMVLPFFADQKTIDKINKDSDFKLKFFDEMDSKQAIK